MKEAVKSKIESSKKEYSELLISLDKTNDVAERRRIQLKMVKCENVMEGMRSLLKQIK